MREPLNKKIPIGLAPFQENGRSKQVWNLPGA